jgi:hypothetical protein
MASMLVAGVAVAVAIQLAERLTVRPRVPDLAPLQAG